MRESTVRLDFTLGGILLRSVKLQGVSVDRAPRMEELPRAVEVAAQEGLPVEGRLPRLRLRPDALVYTPSQYKRMHIDLEGSFPEYLRKLRSDPRRNFKKRVLRFAGLTGGMLDWREYRRAEEMAEFYRLARDVSKKTYQERELDAGLPEGEEFRSELAEQAGREAVRGYLLFHRDQPVAYALCKLEGDALIYDKTGYDPAYREHYPGIVLLYAVLRRLFVERRFRRFDFGPGEFRYKRTLATGNVLCADVYYYRRNPRLLALLCLHSLVGMASQTAGDLMSRLAWKEPAQRWIRRRLGGTAVALRHVFGGERA